MGCWTLIAADRGSLCAPQLHRHGLEAGEGTVTDMEILAEVMEARESVDQATEPKELQQLLAQFQQKAAVCTKVLYGRSYHRCDQTGK